MKVDIGQEGWLRISLLDERLFAAFMQRLLGEAGPTIRLGNIRFAVTEVLGAPGSHPWVGYTKLIDLRQTELSAERWDLEFASPTAIRWAKQITVDDGSRFFRIQGS